MVYKVKVFQVNSNSVFNKLNVIDAFLRKFKDDCIVLIINDTRLKPGLKFTFNGYNVIRFDSPGLLRKPGGSCFIYSKNIHAREVNLPACCPKDLGIVDFMVNGRSIRISTLYLRPKCILRDDHFDFILKNSDEMDAILFMGDLNGHVGLDSHKRNKSGNTVLRNTERLGLNILNKSTPTYESFSNGQTSCIDLSLWKSRKNFKANWDVCKHLDIGSDHHVTLVEIEIGPSTQQTSISIIDWEKFKTATEDFNIVEDFSSLEAIESTIRRFNEELAAILKSCSKVKKRCTRDNVILSSETTELIKLRRRYRTKLQRWRQAGRDVTILRRVVNTLRKAMMKSIDLDVRRKDYLEASNLVEERRSSEFWKKLSKIAPELGKDRSATPGGLVDSDGHFQTSPEKIANIHASRLNDCHDFPTALHFDDYFRRHAEDLVDSKESLLQPQIEDARVPRNDELFEERRIGARGKIAPPKLHDSKVTVQEIKHHLSTKSSKSSPGEDGLNYRAIKNCSLPVFFFLARLFSCLLTAGFFPSVWKSVIVSMIPKPGKNLSKADGYRPISLSSCLSKIFECSIKARLVNELPSDNIHQAAYKRGRSCDEHLLRLTEEVYTAFNRREVVLCVCLDVKGAFDRVWVKGLIFKLLSIRLPLSLLRLSCGFLNTRTLRVRVGGKFSRYVKMRAGTPQGAVISPVLFNYFVDDLRNHLDGTVQLCQFADDICLFIRMKCPRLCEYHLQKQLDKVFEWTSRWRISLAPEKSTCILFTRCPSLKRMKINLKLGGVAIGRENNVRFLGLEFDERLDWNAHCKKMRMRTSYRKDALIRLSRMQKYQRFSFIAKLHDVFINSVFRYGCTSTVIMSKKNLSDMEIYYNNCFRRYFGLPKFISRKLILDMAHVPTFKEMMLLNARKRIANLVAFSPFGNRFKTGAAENKDSTYGSPCDLLLN